jgi:recombination protein RecA
MVSQAIQHIEGLLRARKLDGTLAKLELIPAMAPTGLEAFDRALGGGWRRGELSELTGPKSSGRTSLLVASLAAATSRGEVVGLVDTLDRFDPAGAAEAGVEMMRLLWVRGPSLTSLPARKAQDSFADALIRRALRAADLMIRAGGFGIVALDLGDMPAPVVGRVPATSWLRLAHANEGRDTVGLLLADQPVARSPRGVSVRLSATPRWTGKSAQQKRLDGLTIDVRVTSARHIDSAKVAV